MGIEITPFENYESLLLRLPKFPIGFRGQAVGFNQSTMASGFDRPREYFVAKLGNLGIEETRKVWPTFQEQFQFALGWGHTLNIQTNRKMNVEETISYYEKHPTEYSSILVLIFPGITDWPKTHIKSKQWNYAWFKQKLPAENVAGTIHTQQEDFIEFRKELQKDPNLGKDFQLMHQHLQNKMTSRYLEFLVNFR